MIGVQTVGQFAADVKGPSLKDVRAHARAVR
jgi:hypothetical protein